MKVWVLLFSIGGLSVWAADYYQPGPGYYNWPLPPVRPNYQIKPYQNYPEQPNFRPYGQYYPYRRYTHGLQGHPQISAPWPAKPKADDPIEQPKIEPGNVVEIVPPPAEPFHAHEKDLSTEPKRNWRPVEK